MVTVDTGFDLDESRNQSYIAFEYIEHLAPGMLGFQLLQELALKQRFNYVSKQVPIAFNRYVNQIIRNKKDRFFTKVTYNSIELTLVSHDYTDYQKSKRRKIKKDHNLSIVDASEILDKV